MTHPDYVKTIKEAWNITWTNKYLWWFGLLAGVGGTGGQTNLRLPGENQEQYSRVSEFVSQNLYWIIPAAIGLAILAIILIILSIIGRGALIKSIDLSLKQKRISFREGFREGKTFFWRIFFIGLVTALAILFSIIILSVPIILIFISKAYALGIFMSVFAVLILIALIILAAFLKTYGQIYVVLGKLSAWSAMENAYRLFCRNLLSSVIMGLFLIPIGIAVSLGMIIGLIPIALIFVALGFGLKMALGKLGIIIASTLGALAAVGLILAIQSVFETFVQAIWVIFFKQIASYEEKEAVAEETEKNPVILPTTDTIKTIKSEK